MGSVPTLGLVASLLVAFGLTEGPSAIVETPPEPRAISAADAQGVNQAAISAFDGSADEREDERHVPDAAPPPETASAAARSTVAAAPRTFASVGPRGKAGPGLARAPPG